MVYRGTREWMNDLIVYCSGISARTWSSDLQMNLSFLSCCSCLPIVAVFRWLLLCYGAALSRWVSNRSTPCLGWWWGPDCSGDVVITCVAQIHVWKRWAAWVKGHFRAWWSVSSRKLVAYLAISPPSFISIYHMKVPYWVVLYSGKLKCSGKTEESITG